MLYEIGTLLDCIPLYIPVNQLLYIAEYIEHRPLTNKDICTCRPDFDVCGVSALRGSTSPQLNEN